MISVVNETAALPEPYPHLVQRLSQLSVKKHYEAYRDVEWDGPHGRIDPTDPGFRFGSHDPLAATAWYQGLSQETQARLGLAWACEKLKIGIGFESLLSLGLLEFTHGLPNNSPEYRYAMHEVIEESQHSLMFQQFINQSGLDPVGLSPIEIKAGRRIAHYGAYFPELFFFFVLAGEIFIDRDNRDRLKQREGVHPLLRRLLQIHVTEEARHVCFAERFLQENVPKLSWFRRLRVRLAVPSMMGHGERLMLLPSPALVKAFQIPKAALRQAYGPGTPHAKKVREIVAPVYALLPRRVG